MGLAVGGAGRAVRPARVRAETARVVVVLVVAMGAGVGVKAPGVAEVAIGPKGPSVRASASSPS